MAILANWIDWRARCARRVTVSATLTFADADPDTITRAAGSFVSDGVETGMSVVPVGTASNDARRYRVAGVAASTLTLDADDVVVAEASVAASLDCCHVDPDGVERFPGPFDSTNLVRANGFDGGFSGIVGAGYEGNAVEISVNGGIRDLVKGVDEYDWYLSQRTDVPARQYFTLTQKPDTASQSFSGTVTLLHTALATSVYGVEPSVITVDAFVRLLKFVSLYCRRRSDGAIQWAPLLETMMPK